MLKPTILKNGLNILRIPKTGVDSFTVGFVVKTGSAVEKGNFPLGISTLIERLFWCGTDKHPSKRSLNTALEGIGGKFFSQTNHETTSFYITVPSQHQFKAISMLAEVVQHSYFDVKDIEREKEHLIEEIKSKENTFEYEGVELGLSNIYHNHGLGTPVLGTIETLMPIKQSDVLEYLSKQYNPNQAFLVLSGDFETKQAGDLAEQEWSLWNPKNGQFVETKGFKFSAAGELPKVIYKQRGLSQTQLSIGFLLDDGMKQKIKQDEDEPSKELEKEIVDKTLEDWATLELLNTILGQGFSSRLWTKGVEEEMFFNAIESNVNRFTTTSFLEVLGVTENSQFTFALESSLFALDALKKTTVSINELSKAKEFLKGKIVLDQEDLLYFTNWKVKNFIGAGFPFEVKELLKKIDMVQAADVRALASDIFRPERLFITTLGPAKETRLVEKLIRKYIGEF